MLVCFLALVTWHANCGFFFTPLLSYVACLTLLYFSTLFHKWHSFWKLLDIKCVFLFSLQHVFETFSILRRTEQGMIKNVYWCSCTVPLLSLNILGGFSKISDVKFHENPCSGRRTNRQDAVNSHFSKLCECA